MDCAFSNRFSWVSMVRLAERTEETSADIISCGVVFYAVTPYADKKWRAMLSFLSRPAECRAEMDGVSFPGERPHGQRLRFYQQERDLH